MHMKPMKRMGDVEEIASVVLFPAFDAASLMTGSIVVADAGYLVVKLPGRPAPTTTD
ncbi:NAD(P)-binding domain-containing protein (plasmid) [Rhizobium etli bv. mimosae str. Mim1]|nr:NAD(P)-binding domain-containing protein [Rhizobium etli bv. mimosae str. Mim1]